MIEINKLSLPYLTAMGGVIAFCFSVFRYIDTKKEANKNIRFEQYRKIFEWVAGRTAEGQPLVDTQQAMAVYQLSEFPEYRHMTLPIIEYYLAQLNTQDDTSMFKAALIYTHSKLENIN